MSSETGLAEARMMPTEVRKWWIGEMQREATPAGDVPLDRGKRR